MTKWRAIIFDLDDTLYPEKDYVLSGFRAVANWAAEHLQIPADDSYRELTRLFFAGARGDTFNRWLASRGQPASLVPTLIEVYRRHEPTLRPFPEVTDMLASLHQRFRLGLVTDGHLDVQRSKLAALGLAEHFDAIVFSDEWGRDAWKPSPIPFRIVLERLGVTAEEAVYIADNPAKDFLGARRAGLSSIWCRHSGGEYALSLPPTPDHAADQTAESLARLRAFFPE